MKRTVSKSRIHPGTMLKSCVNQMCSREVRAVKAAANETRASDCIPQACLIENASLIKASKYHPGKIPLREVAVEKLMTQIRLPLRSHELAILQLGPHELAR
jgi:hypothetical protein